MGEWFVYVWPALLLTVIGLALHRASRRPDVSRSDAVLMDLCLGLVTVTASVLWFQVFLTIGF